MKREKVLILRIVYGFLGLLIFQGTLIGRDSSEGTVVRPRVTVEFDNEAVSMAKGYEMAFNQLPPGGKFIKISGGDGEYFLEGSIASISALEGVLYVRMETGLVYIVSARDIVLVTTEKPNE